MRILAIRGKNLASLADFEVKFDTGPLASAGLFAITGPTGAGKSTLLDAMCLALYGRLPRVKAKSRGYEVAADVTGNEMLPFTDLRHIVRRGASEAWAEVEFLGQKDKRWRVRWSVHRARGKLTGKLQDAKVELFDNQGQAQTKHRKEDTLDTIVGEVGLTYEQFCRSVLLAQGDFAMFLKASADDRAQILEALTDGSQLYTELSRAAHNREAQEKAKLQALEGGVGHLQPLSEDERQHIEQQKAALMAECEQLGEEQRKYRELQQWYVKHDALIQEKQEAEKEHNAAQQARHDAQHEALYLEQLKQAEHLRGTYERYHTARATLDNVVTQRREYEQELNQAEELLKCAEAKAEQAEQLLQAARAERDAKQPEITEARRLDGELTQARQVASEAEADYHARDKQLTQSKQALETILLEQAEAREALDRANGWLQDNCRLETLVKQWPRWERCLQDYSRTGRESLRLRADAEKEKQELQQLEARLASAQQAVQSCEDEYSRAKRALEAAQRDVEALPAEHSPEARQAARQQLDAKRRRLQTLKQLWGEITKAEAERSAAEQNRQQAENTLAQLAQQRTALHQERAKLESECSAREQEVRLAEAAEELAARRPDLLKPGQPCPLCGSTEHPAADQPAPPGDIVTRLRQELNEARQQRASCEDQLQKNESRIAAEEMRAEEAARRRSAAVAQYDALLTQWQNVPMNGFSIAPQEPEASSQIDAHLRELEKARADLDAAEKAYEAARNRRDAAQAKVNRVNEQLQQAKTSLHGLEQNHQRVMSQLNHLEQQLQDLANRQREYLQELEAAFSWQAAWRTDLEADPDAFLEKARAHVKAWEVTEEQRRQQTERLREIERKVAICQTEHKNATDALSAAQANAANQAARIAELEQSRAAWLGGRPTDDIVQALDRQVKQAEQEAEAKQKRLLEAKARHAAANKAYQVAQEQESKAKREATQARAALDEALIAAQLTEDELSRLLAIPTNTRQRIQAKLDGLDRAVTSTAGILESKRQALANHLALGRPETALADIETGLTELDTRIAKGREAIGGLTEKLRQDDDLRNRQAELVRELEAQRATYHRWAALDDVIGSSDGKTLRLFVQSLYFDTLLEHANHYLQGLRQRYRLAQVRDAELELQVIDTYLADTVRPISTLSGGETFLVSLALALGLAAMSSNKLTIGSLFIDEGFGTLDPQSLETALVMLDQLQAQGRQIGIISHIPELADRIGYRIEVIPNGNGTSQVRVIELS